MGLDIMLPTRTPQQGDADERGTVQYFLNTPTKVFFMGYSFAIHYAITVTYRDKHADDQEGNIFRVFKLMAGANLKIAAGRPR